MNDELESRLRDALRNRADSTRSERDWEDVLRRTQRGRDHRQVLARVAILVALIAGPVAGFAAARAIQSDRGVSIVASGASGSSPGVPSGMPSASAFAPGFAPVGCTATSTTGDLNGLRASAATVCPALDHWLRREAGGVSIRVYRIPGAPPATCSAPDVIAEFSNVGAVGIGSASQASVDSTATVATAGSFGAAEGAPVQWVIVQLGSAIASRATSVRATFAAGGDDQMHPVAASDGHAIAVLAHATPAGAPIAVSVSVVDGSGGTLAWVQPGGTTACNTGPGPVPPSAGGLRPSSTAPTLPAPGVPPVDRNAAQQAIIDAYEHVYKADLTIGEGSPFIDDAHGLNAAKAQLEQLLPNAVPSLSIKIREVRFVSTTEAAVLYDLADANGQWPSRVGGARLVSGGWKVTRATVCNDLALGGVQCPP